ncbi:MmgE/PrpD family protein [Bacillus sp. JCM 19041]|uniref:MmgE/PrpD family protein n=1 Tax=Bacillus sp. JCM 19041 TaxID=1460637 RepID=UPI0006D2354E
MNHTESLTHFCHATYHEQLPNDVQEMTKKLLLDCIGVTLRSSEKQASTSILKTALSLSSKGDSTVFGTTYSLPSQYAALVNGTTAHGIELDDVTSESSLHPGVVVIPVALAVAEEQNNTPDQVIRSIVAGYEMMMRLGEAITNPSGNYERGFHPTGICGVFGATMAAGCLLGLKKEEMLHAIGIAGSMASGSMEYLSNGAWTKKLHAGWAAHNGIIAAKSAANGFVGPATIFEGTFGFFKAYASIHDANKLHENRRAPYKIIETNIKLHACCRYMHAQMDAAKHLYEEHDFHPDDIIAIDTTVLTGGEALVAVPLEAKQTPDNVVDAQFSLPYGIAVVLTYGKGGYHEFDESIIHAPSIKRLMKTVRISKQEKYDSLYPKKWGASVQITLKDGRILKKEINHPQGGWPGSVATWESITTKFLDLTDGIVEKQAQIALIESIKSFDSAKSGLNLREILLSTTV